MAARATTANQVEPSLEDVDYNKWHTHAACHAILSLNFMLQIMVFWEDLTYHTVSWDPERQTVCRQITIYSVCPLSYFFQPHRVYTHTNTQKEMLKKKVGAKKRWERTCIAWKNKISLCPRHQQYHIKQAAIAAEDNFSNQRTERSDVNGGYQVMWEIFLTEILTLSTLQCSRDVSLKSVNDKHAFYASVFGSVFFDIGNLSLTNIEQAPGRLHVHILK